MEKKNFDGIMDQLMSEYANSGMSMDDFIKAKLKASGRPDAEQCAADIIDTINGINAAFTRLQKSKAEGYNREEFGNRRYRHAVADHSGGVLGQITGCASQLRWAKT